MRVMPSARICAQHRLEGSQVSMNIGDDRDAIRHRFGSHFFGDAADHRVGRVVDIADVVADDLAHAGGWRP